MADIDDKTRKNILNRIRAMMQRTVANGCTEAEADAAAALVDKLMGVYEIGLSEASVQEQEVMRVDIELAAHPVRFAAVAVAGFTDCRAWLDGESIAFLGIDIDTEVAEYLMLLFQRAIDQGMRDFGAFNAEMALMDKRGREQMIQSFAVGMGKRLGERLSLLKSKRDFTQKATGFDLVVSKGALVKEAWESLGITLTAEKAGRSVRHAGAYNAGRSAADGVSISQGVAGRAGGGKIR